MKLHLSCEVSDIEYALYLVHPVLSSSLTQKLIKESWIVLTVRRITWANKGNMKGSCGTWKVDNR